MPSWAEITEKEIPIRVIFDLPEDLSGFAHGKTHLSRNAMRTIQYKDDTWFTSNSDGKFHLYSGYNKGLSGNPASRKISIMGLILTYNEKDGSLVLNPCDFRQSKKVYPTIPRDLKGQTLGYVVGTLGDSSSKKSSTEPHEICNVKWSNSLRFDPRDQGGKCLHFTASTDGEIFLVFSIIPSKKSTWYYVHIGKEEVSINKVS